MSNKNWQDREVGALWKHDDKTPRYCGYVCIEGEKRRVIIFKNNHKKTPNQPDLKIYSDERR